jgi:hypothetical protein
MPLHPGGPSRYLRRCGITIAVSDDDGQLSPEMTMEESGTATYGEAPASVS